MTGKTKEMPALANPRWERFAQLIVEGLMNGDRKAYSQGRAYIAAGYEAKDAGKRGGSAEAAASRLLNRVKPIIDRVRELQAEANKRLQPKLDLSRERIGRRLDKASRIAEEQGNASAMVTSELGIAKVFHSAQEQEPNPLDFKNAKSMHDIGRKLLMSVGYENPDEASIALAIEANDAFVDRLEAIRAAADATVEDD
jgi:hypothetical protein